MAYNYSFSRDEDDLVRSYFEEEFNLTYPSHEDDELSSISSQDDHNRQHEARSDAGPDHHEPSSESSCRPQGPRQQGTAPTLARVDEQQLEQEQEAPTLDQTDERSLSDLTEPNSSNKDVRADPWVPPCNSSEQTTISDTMSDFATATDSNRASVSRVFTSGTDETGTDPTSLDTESVNTEARSTDVPYKAESTSTTGSSKLPIRQGGKEIKCPHPDCSRSNRIYASHDSLRSHRRKHGLCDTCPKCGRKFTKGQLPRHLTQIKRDCSKDTKSKRDTGWKKDTKWRQNPKMKKCSHCSYASRSDDVKRHEDDEVCLETKSKPKRPRNPKKAPSRASSSSAPARQFGALAISADQPQAGGSNPEGSP